MKSTPLYKRILFNYHDGYTPDSGDYPYGIRVQPSNILVVAVLAKVYNDDGGFIDMHLISKNYTGGQEWEREYKPKLQKWRREMYWGPLR